MTFGEKIKNARLALNLSHYSYEQTGTFPKFAVLKKLAEARDKFSSRRL